MKTVILGLGNPLLHDDGAGIEVIRQLETTLSRPDVDLKSASVGGLRILDLLTGYDRAIIVDALMTGAPAGTVSKMKVEELAGNLHASCVHDLSFTEALNLGRAMEMHLPSDITIYGIEITDPYTLKEECSPAVLEGTRVAANRIMENLVEDR